MDGARARLAIQKARREGRERRGGSGLSLTFRIRNRPIEAQDCVGVGGREVGAREVDLRALVRSTDGCRIAKTAQREESQRDRSIETHFCPAGRFWTDRCCRQRAEQHKQTPAARGSSQSHRLPQRAVSLRSPRPRPRAPNTPRERVDSRLGKWARRPVAPSLAGGQYVFGSLSTMQHALRNPTGNEMLKLWTTIWHERPKSCYDVGYHAIVPSSPRQLQIT